MNSTSPNLNAAPRVYKTTEAVRNSRKRYRQTEKGKNAASRYNASQKGKATALRYYHSEKGKEVRERYKSTPESKAIKEAYAKSDRGKECIQRNTLIASLAAKSVGGTKQYRQMEKAERIALHAKIRAELDAQQEGTAASQSSNVIESNDVIENNEAVTESNEAVIASPASSVMTYESDGEREDAQCSAPELSSVDLLEKHIARLGVADRTLYVNSLPQSVQDELFSFNNQNIKRALVRHFQKEEILPEEQVSSFVVKLGNSLIDELMCSIDEESQSRMIDYMSEEQYEYLMSLLDEFKF